MANISQLISLKDRVALITGASGGIGRATCETLAELGANLLLLDRDNQTLSQQAESLSQEFGVQTDFLAIDLESETDRALVPSRANETFGRLDLLVNNAAFVGDSQLTGWAVPFEQQEISTWRRAMEVNLTACFHLSQLLSPLLRTHSVGSIINVGSIYGVVGPDFGLYAGTTMGNPAAYAASKGGLIQLTRWLATVLAPEIRVNSFCPGGVHRGQPESFVDRYEKKTPLGRMANEQDFKGTIAYLASDLSKYVTGQNLMVDGGWTAW